jgi:hypothetical protein
VHIGALHEDRVTGDADFDVLGDDAAIITSGVAAWAMLYFSSSRALR